jgi:hypothetical protein
MIFLFVILLTLLAVYVLIAAVILHSAIAYILAGAFLGVAIGALAFRWRSPSKWFHYMPWVFALIFLVTAISRLFGPKVTDVSTALGVAFVVSYICNLLYEQFDKTRAVERKRISREASFQRSFLRGEVLRVIGTMRAGESNAMLIPHSVGLALMTSFRGLQASGWQVIVFPYTPVFVRRIALWYVIITAPDTEEELLASLEKLQSENPEE